MSVDSAATVGANIVTNIIIQDQFFGRSVHLEHMKVVQTFVELQGGELSEVYVGYSVGGRALIQSLLT